MRATVKGMRERADAFRKRTRRRPVSRQFARVLLFAGLAWGSSAGEDEYSCLFGRLIGRLFVVRQRIFALKQCWQYRKTGGYVFPECCNWQRFLISVNKHFIVSVFHL